MVRANDVQWVAILSGQDYPIKPLALLEEMLSRSEFDAHFEATTADGLNRDERSNFRHRYYYQYGPRKLLDPSSRDSSEKGLRRAGEYWLDVASFGVNHIQRAVHIYRFPPPIPRSVGWRARWTPYTEGSPCWKSSAWMVLSTHAIRELLAFVDEYPEYVRYYRRTAIPEESATATVLCNLPSVRVEPHPLQYTRWSHPKLGHPDVLREADLDTLLTVPHFFARKFDITVDSGVLDRIDEWLG